MADKTWANFKTFFANEHHTWKETQPLSDGGVYPSANALDQKADETINAITLLDVATTIDHETYSNLTTTTNYITTKLSLASKNLVATLKYNAHLERLLGQFRIGGRMRKERAQVDPSQAHITVGLSTMTPYIPVLSTRIQRRAM